MSKILKDCFHCQFSELCICNLSSFLRNGIEDWMGPKKNDLDTPQSNCTWQIKDFNMLLKIIVHMKSYPQHTDAKAAKATNKNPTIIG